MPAASDAPIGSLSQPCRSTSTNAGEPAHCSERAVQVLRLLSVPERLSATWGRTFSIWRSVTARTSKLLIACANSSLVESHVSELSAPSADLNAAPQRAYGLASPYI